MNFFPSLWYTVSCASISESKFRLSHPLFYQSLLPTGPSFLPQGYRKKTIKNIDGSSFSILGALTKAFRFLLTLYSLFWSVEFGLGTEPCLWKLEYSVFFCCCPWNVMAWCCPIPLLDAASASSFSSSAIFNFY